MGDKKLKLLYLAKYLEEETDQEHPAGMPELLAYLTANGISAERKSVYDDLRLLESFGMDVETVKGRQFGYYLGERTFQLPEVKLLVDAVQAAPFLTQKKSMELIGKLEQLTSRPMARQLRRQVYVLGRPRTTNETLYYAVDGIHTAISGTDRCPSVTSTGRRRGSGPSAGMGLPTSRTRWPCAWTGTITWWPTTPCGRTTATTGWTG